MNTASTNTGKLPTILANFVTWYASEGYGCSEGEIRLMRKAFVAGARFAPEPAPATKGKVCEFCEREFTSTAGLKLHCVKMHDAEMRAESADFDDDHVFDGAFVDFGDQRD